MGDFSYSLNVAHLFMNDGAPGISGRDFLSLFLFFFPSLEVEWANNLGQYRGFPKKLHLGQEKWVKEVESRGLQRQQNLGPLVG